MDLFSEIVNESRRQHPRRYAPSTGGGELMMTNYLSPIIFFVLMAIGYYFFWGDMVLTPEPTAAGLGWAAAWTFVSGYFAAMVKIAAQWEKALIFRLGRFRSIKGPGVFTILPMLDSVRKIDTRVVTMDIPRQEAITQDNVPISIDGVIFMRVSRPNEAVINVQDYAFAITQYAQTALRDVIGGRTLDDVLTDREGIGHTIEQLVDRETEAWGLEVTGIRIQDIILPEDLKRVMSRQAAAEREKRANITKSEGDRIAAENLAAAAHTMAASPGAMQLRTLQTVDGLGPTASNTVVLALPIEITEALGAYSAFVKQRDQTESS